MTKFYIVRHGQSEGNAKRSFLGHTDLGLTELGHMQGQRTAEYLADKGIDVIYTSDLVRARDTARPLGEIIGIEPIPSKGLREIFAGEWEGRPMVELLERYPQYQVWLTDIGRSCCDGGESMVDLYHRAQKEMVRIAEENPGRTVMVATHAAFIRAMCCVFNNIDIRDAQTIPWVSNSSVTCVNYSDGRWEPEYIGYSDHLGELVSTIPVCN